ncbi:VOC family protein [Ruminococcaceae bacterium OttesenSCG-928-L11]|nr:VOC family protein [Ruminococcaceae bacterium OttesenSCG-928-L11]
MKYSTTVIAVKDVNRARRFYEDIFGLELYQDYGRNIVFTCGLSLQQDFDWLVDISKEEITWEPRNMELCFEEEQFDAFLEKLQGCGDIRFLGDVVEHEWGQRTVRFFDLDGHLIEVGEDMKMVIKRFLSSGLSMEETSVKMGASVADLEKLLNG